MISQNPHYHPDTPTLPCFDGCTDVQPLTDQELEQLLRTADADLLAYVKANAPGYLSYPRVLAAIRETADAQAAAEEALQHATEASNHHAQAQALVDAAAWHARRARLYALVCTAMAITAVFFAVYAILD